MRLITIAATLGVGLCTTLGAQSTKVNPRKHDTSFTAMQKRGEKAMGVDQYTSTHKFDSFPDGGRIELQRKKKVTLATLPQAKYPRLVEWNPTLGWAEREAIVRWARRGARTRTCVLLSEPPRMNPPMRTFSADWTTPRVLMFASFDAPPCSRS